MYQSLINSKELTALIYLACNLANSQKQNFFWQELAKLLLFCNFWSKPCSARLLEQWTYYEVFVCNLQSSNRVKLLDVCKLQSKVNFVKGYFSFSTFFNMIGERLRSFPSNSKWTIYSCLLLRITMEVL